MARKSNVNPDHYKTAGREPVGQDVVHEVERQKMSQKQARLNRVSPSSPATQSKASAAGKTEQPPAGPPPPEAPAKKKRRGEA